MTVANPPVGSEEGEAPPVYGDHVEFFHQEFRAWFAEPSGGTRQRAEWCPKWREHPEADRAVDALWRAWEVLQRDPGAGLAVWLANYAYPILDRLTDQGGTFAACARRKHKTVDELADETDPA